MFSRKELEEIWTLSERMRKQYPSTYENLMGYQRLAVLRLLDEPVQSTLHQIIQMNVKSGTRCLYKGCSGFLSKNGRCSNDCEQLGINVVDDIIACQNCDCYGFPCPTCYAVVFHKQLNMSTE